MITVRKSNERGHANHGWLNTFHTFSFADYYDPQHMGFGPLRVINEDRVAGETGFGTHGHRDMEIITYVVDGRLDHKDSMGTQKSIRRGEVQRMSAGTGVLHSEMNATKEPVHFLQIWIIPEQRSLEPSYEQKLFSDDAKSGKLLRVADDKGRDGALRVHQDISLYASLLGANEKLTHTFERSNGWVQVVRGEVKVNGTLLEAGDGASLANEKSVTLEAAKPAELLLFDMGG